MGYSIRTSKYRYTRWQKANDPKMLMARELYDLETDPQSSVNIADNPKYRATVAQLEHLMKKLKIGNEQVPSLYVN